MSEHDCHGLALKCPPKAGVLKTGLQSNSVLPLGSDRIMENLTHQRIHSSVEPLGDGAWLEEACQSMHREGYIRFAVPSSSSASCSL